MDVDATIAEIRCLIADFHTEQWKDTSDVIMEVAEDLIDRFTALDAWLASGGFLPAVWQQAKTP